MSTPVWESAQAAANLTLDLPGGVPLFLRRIPAGKFCVGGRGEYADEEPRNEVALKEFFLGTFAVTQQQWRAVAERCDALRDKSDPSHFKGPRRPVENVSWDDSAAWFEELMKWPGFPLELELEARLPTEAEWEYACRAGSETDYYNGDGEAALAEVGWYDGNAEGRTHDVDEPVGGRVEAHPWGLHGMHGNVWEWCRDVYRRGGYRTRVDDDSDAEETLREGETYESQLRVIRGGSWRFVARFCRSASRFRFGPGARYRFYGFRVCLAPRSGGSQSTGKEQAKAQPGAGDGGGGTPPESDAPGGARAGGREIDLAEARLPRPEKFP
jgi:formylglycine-generating enzyme required for sulfatase activity